jgi:galactonate dehydratase
VGSDITAAFSLHFGGVLRQAVWPAVNCHQLFETRLLTAPIVVQGGRAEVPNRPGLGFELNEDAVARMAVDRPASRPDPERLIETTWADGRRMYTANNGEVNFMLSAANAERYPYFAPGADTRLIPDDGTARWRNLYDKARQNGPVEG